MKKLKVFIVMNRDEHNGYGGVLWCSQRGEEKEFIPLAVFSDREQSTKMATRTDYYKVVEAELRFRI